MTSITVQMEQAGLAASVEHESAKKSLELLKGSEIQTDAHLHGAVSYIAEHKNKFAAAVEKRDSFTGPLKKAIAEIQITVTKLNDVFEPAMTSLKECEATAKKKIVAFAEAQAVERRKMIQSAGDASAAGETAVAQEHIKRAEAYEVPKVAGMSLRRAVEFQVLDAGDAVAWCVQNGRLDLLTLDEKACKALAKAGKLPEMDGVRWGETYSVAVTADKVKR